MNQANWLTWIAVLLVVAACQTGTGPQNVTEAIGTGYATLTTVAHDVAAAHVAGTISDADASKYKAQLQASKDNLDQASAAYAAGDPANAASRVQQTQLVLRVIIQALQTSGAKTHG